MPMILPLVQGVSSSSPTHVINSSNTTNNNNNNNSFFFFPTTSFPFNKSSLPTSLINVAAAAADEPSRSSPTTTTVTKLGICRASQAVELFPTVCPEVVVREARLEDCWEVAETHCSSFFPDYSFPLDLALRVDRIVGMLSGFSIPIGCRRTCLVAVVRNDDKFFIGSEEFKVSFNRKYIAGILTVDTVADFLPRKGPYRQRRTGIAYVSNVAVREKDRRKGIAKRLVVKAEAQARSWGCRAIALHCDMSNPAATQLYKGQGFKSINVPERANWPQPKASPNTQFSFMMKLLNTRTTSSVS